MEKPAAALKFVEFSTVPEASLAILVITEPASVLVKAVIAFPVASEFVKVTFPGDRAPRAVPAVPKVALRPLMDAADSVATLERGVILADALDGDESPAMFIAFTVKV